MRSLPAWILAATLPAAIAAEPPLTLDRVKSAASELEKLTKEEMAKTGVPGIAIAIVFQDQVVFAKGFGVRKAGAPETVDADTVFQLASVSKPLGSTVVAAAVGQGAASWDSRINDLDPAFAMSAPWITSEITVRDFYAHRSGLPDHAGDLLEDIGYSREQILHRLRYQKPDSSFRSAYAYTNYGLTEGAVAVSRAAGKSWEDLSEELLYRPLGMASTSSRLSDLLARPNRAFGHVKIDGKWVAKYQRDPDAQSPAGGASSSVNDMAKWIRLQIGNGTFEGRELVNRKALEETHFPQIRTGFNHLNGMPAFYGLGWNVGYDTSGRLRISHSGAFALGAATAVYILPKEQLGIVILTNSSPIGLPEGLASTFLDLALYGKPQVDWLGIFQEAFDQMAAVEAEQIADYSKSPAAPAPPAALSSYTGTYANNFFGEIAVTEEKGALALALGPKGEKFPLRHWDRDIFIYDTATETLIGPSGLFFTLGPDGKASGVTVENLNRLGEGHFPRK